MQPFLRLLGIVISTIAVVVLLQGTSVSTPALAPDQLPPARVHPLPPTLAQWQDLQDQGDYFDQIKPTEVGYLVWSSFPIKVHIQVDSAPTSGGWESAMVQAVSEWSAYLPLERVTQPDLADIQILRSAPPLRLSPSEPGKPPQLERVRSAETRYQFWIQRVSGQSPRLIHRCQIFLKPNQASAYLQSAARHELGHALGIWGHSPEKTDTMYFAQVRTPPAISVRDVNTLKRIYQQPTALGWTLPKS